MGDVTLDMAEGVATFTLDNPEVRNALSEDMARRLMELCDEVDAEPKIGAAVLQGSGTTFCSGADTRVLLSAEHADRQSSPTTASIYESFLRVGNLQMQIKGFTDMVEQHEQHDQTTQRIDRLQTASTC